MKPRILQAYLLNFLLPNRCPACGAFLTENELLCDTCAEAILLPHDDYCHRCGKLMCLCKKRTFAYDMAIVISRYTDDPEAPAVRAIWELKNSRNRNFAYFTGIIAAERLRHSLDYGDYDLVTAVPMHHTKQRVRGYNQAAVIGRELAAEMQIPYRNDLLYKRRSRLAQHRLTAAQRAKNVAVFGANDIDLSGKRILLCDDVLTTGATLDRCAALLKSCGASFVTVVAAATTNTKRPEEDDLFDPHFPEHPEESDLSDPASEESDLFDPDAAT